MKCPIGWSDPWLAARMCNFPTAPIAAVTKLPGVSGTAPITTAAMVILAETTLVMAGLVMARAIVAVV